MNDFFAQKRQHFRITNRVIFLWSPNITATNPNKAKKMRKIPISDVQKFFNSPKFTKVPISHINTRPKGFSPCHSLLLVRFPPTIHTIIKLFWFFSALTVQPPLTLITSKTALPNILKITSNQCIFPKIDGRHEL